MSIDGATRGGRLGSTSQYRLVPARKNRSRGRLGLENEPTAFAAAHRRVRVRSVATVSAVATVKIDRGRQYRPSSLALHWVILPTTRTVSGNAALVTTPLRLPVTRAPSVQARHAPGIRLSQGLLLIGWCNPSERWCLPTGAHRRR